MCPLAHAQCCPAALVLHSGQSLSMPLCWSPRWGDGVLVGFDDGALSCVRHLRFLLAALRCAAGLNTSAVGSIWATLALSGGVSNSVALTARTLSFGAVAACVGGSE